METTMKRFMVVLILLLIALMAGCNDEAAPPQTKTVHVSIPPSDTSPPVKTPQPTKSPPTEIDANDKDNLMTTGS